MDRLQLKVIVCAGSGAAGRGAQVYGTDESIGRELRLPLCRPAEEFNQVIAKAAKHFSKDLGPPGLRSAIDLSFEHI